MTYLQIVNVFEAQTGYKMIYENRHIRINRLLSITENNNEQIVYTTYVFHNSVAANAHHNSLAGNVNTA